jgi:peptidoglycan hydrolase CwlO-like protein
MIESHANFSVHLDLSITTNAQIGKSTFQFASDDWRPVSEQKIDKCTSDIQQLRAGIGILQRSCRRKNKVIRRLKTMYREARVEAADTRRIVQQQTVLLERIRSRLETSTQSNPSNIDPISRFAQSEDSTLSNNDLNSTVRLSIDEEWFM